MKRRFYALTLVVAMLAMTLVGCGSDTTTTNTQKEEQSVEQQEPIEEIIDADGTFEIKYILPYLTENFNCKNKRIYRWGT